MLRPDTFALTALLALLTALGPLAVDMYLPSFPDIGRLLGASPATVQLTLSLYMVSYAAGQIVYGPLSDRFGRIPVMRARARDLLRGVARLRARAEHRDAARRTRAPGARLVRRHRAGAGDRARPLFRRARRARAVADGRHHGAGAGRRADDRRRAAKRVRLALAFRAADRVRADRGVLRLAQAARDAARADARAVLAARDLRRLPRRSCATARCSPMSACWR